jgi:hypothetical protein
MLRLRVCRNWLKRQDVIRGQQESRNNAPPATISHWPCGFKLVEYGHGPKKFTGELSRGERRVRRRRQRVHAAIQTVPEDRVRVLCARG